MYILYSIINLIVISVNLLSIWIKNSVKVILTSQMSPFADRPPQLIAILVPLYTEIGHNYDNHYTRYRGTFLRYILMRTIMSTYMCIRFIIDYKSTE